MRAYRIKGLQGAANGYATVQVVGWSGSELTTLSEEIARFAKVRAVAAGPDYDLWKYLQDRADQIKERLWTTATWLISVQAAFLTLLFSAEILQFTMDSPVQFSICLPIPAFFLCLFGVGISVYSLVVIDDAVGQSGSFESATLRGGVVPEPMTLTLLAIGAVAVDGAQHAVLQADEGRRIAV